MGCILSWYKYRIYRTLIVALALVFPASITMVESACFARELKPIRIGGTVSLEGMYSEPSLMMREGFRLWEKQVNARGGLLGRPVELVFYDDKGSEDLVRH